MKLTKWGKEHYTEGDKTLCGLEPPQRAPKRLKRARRLCVQCKKLKAAA